jgi:hypothetical protein
MGGRAVEAIGHGAHVCGLVRLSFPAERTLRRLPVKSSIGRSQLGPATCRRTHSLAHAKKGNNTSASSEPFGLRAADGQAFKPFGQLFSCQ